MHAHTRTTLYINIYKTPNFYIKKQGLDRFDCREKLWADMDQQGLVLKVEKHAQRVPISQRGGEVIEPLVRIFWGGREVRYILCMFMCLY